MNMQKLVYLIQTNEEWLMARILHYSKKHNYVKYTSTLLEAWRISIQGLSRAVIEVCKHPRHSIELDPDEDFSKDPMAAFGILEAERHRERGIELGMFLGLYKYYKQSYEDLVKQTEFDSELKEESLRIIARIFDRIEIGFVVSWTAFKAEDENETLVKSNREITNEKNRLLTILESITDPIILLNKNNQVDFINLAAAKLLGISNIPGGYYYHHEKKPLKIKLPGTLKVNLDSFLKRNAPVLSETFGYTDTQSKKQYQVLFTRMVDISDKFKGILLVFQDITERVKAEEAQRKAEALEKVKELAGAVAHEFSQPLQVLANISSLFQKGEIKKDLITKADQMLHRIQKLTADLVNITHLGDKQYLDTQILDLHACTKNKRLEKGDRILIVDDEEYILDTMLDMFQVKGYECDGANNGNEALELLKDKPYKMIISDVMMPVMSGPQLFKKVKSLDYDSIFIFITGYEMSDELKTVASAADGVFPKPVNINQFFAQLEHLD